MAVDSSTALATGFLRVEPATAATGHKDRAMILSAQEQAAVRDVRFMVEDNPAVEIVNGDRRAPASGPLLDVLRRVTQALDRGQAVMVLTESEEDVELTSQEAADFLNVSRPHIVKLAREQVIPHRKVGNRHRFKLADVRTYEERIARTRADALHDLAQESDYTEEDFRL